MDCIDICVPTPLRKTKDPDMSYVVQAVEAVRQHLRKGQLVILESTTYPGTTDELVKPMLEETGLKAGQDFYLAFSPERVDPGNPQYLTKDIPKVVGGFDEASTDIACALYGAVVTKTVPVSSTVVAEMVKLLENTFRSVNIGLVNEIALMCHRMKIDVWEVIDAAKTKPFGFMPFYPGPGPGRPLHPDRPVLPVVEGAPERLRGAVHRAGRPGEQLDARVRRHARRRRAQLGQEGRSTARASTCSASPTRRTWATCASRRRST